MAFVHGKNSVFFLRDAGNTWQDMTPYVSEVTLPGKAGVAETSVFGRGAKTYIGGLLEGQLTVKGFFDATATTGPDAILSGLLGTQPNKGLTSVAQVTTQSNYGQFILCPSGLVSTGIAALGDVVLTDYSLTDPVSGVVSYTATFNLSGATAASSTMNSGTTTGAYGLQVIRAVNSVVFSTGWITSSGGAALAATSSAQATALGTK